MVDFHGNKIRVGDLVSPYDCEDWVGIVIGFELDPEPGYDNYPFTLVVWNKGKDSEPSAEWAEQLVVLGRK